MPSLGISVIICCYNSRSRLLKTLEHLAAQKLRSDILWEIILVDNNSTDGTSEFAKSFWNVKNIPLILTTELNPGLTHARQKGIETANYDYVCFVDDDNGLNSNYLQTAYAILENDPLLAACGGPTEAVLESPAPAWWIPKYQLFCAVGNQRVDSGYHTKDLWGCGLFIRKAALIDLQKNGFSPTLSDRTKNTILSGGDTELCFALLLAGWKLWYDQQLTLKHYIPEIRLDWNYIIKLFYACGYQSVYLDPYEFFYYKKPLPKKQFWGVQIIKEALRIFIKTLLMEWRSTTPGNERTLMYYFALGKLRTLWRLKSQYYLRFHEIGHATWNRVNPLS
jgi:glycosyltransferase involved in cell wall biosynthesis